MRTAEEGEDVGSHLSWAGFWLYGSFEILTFCPSFPVDNGSKNVSNQSTRLTLRYGFLFFFVRRQSLEWNCCKISFRGCRERERILCSTFPFGFNLISKDCEELREILKPLKDSLSDLKRFSNRNASLLPQILKPFSSLPKSTPESDALYRPSALTSIEQRKFRKPNENSKRSAD